MSSYVVQGYKGTHWLSATLVRDPRLITTLLQPVKDMLGRTCCWSDFCDGVWTDQDCSIGAFESSFSFFGVTTGVDPFVAAFSTLEIDWCCSSDERLYARTPSILRCPVLSMISCSSAQLWNNLVAFVTLREWFVLNPVISAVSQRCFTVLDSVLWPTATLEYHVIPFGFFNGLK